MTETDHELGKETLAEVERFRSEKTGPLGMASLADEPQTGGFRLGHPLKFQRKDAKAQRHSAAEPQPNRSADLESALDGQTRKADCKSALRPLRKIFAAREDLDVLQCRGRMDSRRCGDESRLGDWKHTRATLFATLQCYLPTSTYSDKIFGKPNQPQRRDERREDLASRNLCVHRVSAVHSAWPFSCGSAALCLGVFAFKSPRPTGSLCLERISKGLRALLALVLWMTTGLGICLQGGVAKDQVTLDLMAQAWNTNAIFGGCAKVSVYTDVQQNAGYMASGVLISSNWVITAGHVITEAAVRGLVIEQIRFKMGPDPLQPLRVVLADFWTNYPGYHPGTPAGQGVDLGLIRLSEAVASVSPAIPYSGSSSDLMGRHCWTTGNGLPGIAGQGVVSGANLQRAGQNIIGDSNLPGWADRNYLCCSFNAPDEATAQPLEWMGSSGDSGGGWWDRLGGQWQLVGITSATTTDSYYNFGNKTIAYPVALQLDWIYGVMGVLPALSLQTVDAATVRLQWPSWATSFALQTSTNLSATNWTAVATSPTDDGTTESVIATRSSEVQFWRLAKQPAPAARARRPRRHASSPHSHRPV